MARIINCFNRDEHRLLLDAMHVDRKRVFVDLLKWDVPHDARHERDQYDDDDAVYLVVADEATGKHRASARLLRTDRAHILGTLFPQLCAGPVPRGPQVREITRFCLAPGIGRCARLAARNQLIQALVEYALIGGIRTYTGVAEIAWLTQILAAGWEVRPLGLPQAVGDALLGALEISITSRTLKQLVPAWQCAPGTMRVVEFALPLAA